MSSCWRLLYWVALEIAGGETFLVRRLRRRESPVLYWLVLALWALGGDVIRPFAIAMAIGIVVGTYSSIYIAAPTLLLLESRFGDSAPPAARPTKRAKARV